MSRGIAPLAAVLAASLAALATGCDLGGEDRVGGDHAMTPHTLTMLNPFTASEGSTDFADEVFTNVTITASGALIYNDTQANRAVAVLDFGGDKSATAADFTIIFPAAAAATAIIRLV